MAAILLICLLEVIQSRSLGVLFQPFLRFGKGLLCLGIVAAPLYFAQRYKILSLTQAEREQMGAYALQVLWRAKYHGKRSFVD